jgi:hypothetical protein
VEDAAASIMAIVGFLRATNVLEIFTVIGPMTETKKKHYKISKLLSYSRIMPSVFGFKDEKGGLFEFS